MIDDELEDLTRADLAILTAGIVAAVALAAFLAGPGLLAAKLWKRKAANTGGAR